MSKTGIPWVELAWKRESAGGEIRVGAVRQEHISAYKHPDNNLRAEIDIKDTLEAEFSAALGYPHDARPVFALSETQIRLHGRNVAFHALVNPADETEWVAFSPYETAWIYARSIGVPMTNAQLVKFGS